MIARILTEAVVPVKNNKTLEKHIKEWDVPHGRYERLTLSDRKPGTWFVIEFDQDEYDNGYTILVYSFSFTSAMGLTDCIRASDVSGKFPQTLIMKSYNYGIPIDPEDPDCEEKAKINSNCVRKLMRDLTTVSSADELANKMQKYFQKSQHEKVWR